MNMSRIPIGMYYLYYNIYHEIVFTRKPYEKEFEVRTHVEYSFSTDIED